MKIQVRLSASKYLKDVSHRREMFEITKKYLQKRFEIQKYLFLEEALEAFGFSTAYPASTLRSAWLYFDKRNKISIKFKYIRVLERKELKTGKKYYKKVPVLVFELDKNSEYAEAFAMASEHRIVKKDEGFKIRNGAAIIFSKGDSYPL